MFTVTRTAKPVVNYLLGHIMNAKIKYPSDKEPLFKSYYRRFLVLVASGITAISCVGCVSGALADSLPRYFILLGPLVILVFVAAVLVFNVHFRSLRKKDGVEDAEWRAYLFRQPIRLHAAFIGVAILCVMFVAFKCIRYVYPGIVHGT
jgi:hypothetical protein